MSQINLASHQDILHFPKGGKPQLAANEWQIWSDSQDEGGLPDLEHGAHKVLVPFRLVKRFGPWSQRTSLYLEMDAALAQLLYYANALLGKEKFVRLVTY